MNAGQWFLEYALVDEMQTCFNKPYNIIQTKPLISHISQKPVEMALNYNIRKYIPFGH